MSKKVLDSYSLLVYFEHEPGYEKMAEHIEKAAGSMQNLLLSVVNWGEVFYAIYREYSLSRANEVVGTIDTLPIDIIPADMELTKQAAIFKANHKMSYADCFAAALAKLRKAELITGDKEFEQLKHEIKINWI
ncbi:MAG TPA: type II toxin-antitoxin system VapC family toxin [Candidatus Brocadiia bacterium]|nr:type II toxin-antitoxin system VapC family toxin [Planctomycetota bacterium]MBI4008538.1 type II toxin-antitoxin system VapC family toxin [Planctomycetota bacterium]MDO8094487.1 type II toxin-antitoxin system VapC family toxin [Candidatus Brocadiales bacterium]